jgi:hypothetical protein
VKEGEMNGQIKWDEVRSFLKGFRGKKKCCKYCINGEAQEQEKPARTKPGGL